MPPKGKSLVGMRFLCPGVSFYVHKWPIEMAENAKRANQSIALTILRSQMANRNGRERETREPINRVDDDDAFTISSHLS